MKGLWELVHGVYECSDEGAVSDERHDTNAWHIHADVTLSSLEYHGIKCNNEIQIH